MSPRAYDKMKTCEIISKFFTRDDDKMLFRNKNRQLYIKLFRSIISGELFVNVTRLIDRTNGLLFLTHRQCYLKKSISEIYVVFTFLLSGLEFKQKKKKKLKCGTL